MSDTKLSEKLEKIVKEIEGLTVIEMADLAKYLEEKFGISPMSIGVAAQTPVAASTEKPKEEEKTIFRIVLTAVGDNKLGVIKAVREILPNLGLMEAKKFVESAPQEFQKDFKKEEAEEVKKKIEAAGGKVEIK